MSLAASSPPCSVPPNRGAASSVARRSPSRNDDSAAPLPHYRRWRLRAADVQDRQQAGKTVQEVLGFGGNIPVVRDFERGLALGKGATAVMIGIAPAGGRLPDEWKGG